MVLYYDLLCYWSNDARVHNYVLSLLLFLLLLLLLFSEQSLEWESFEQFCVWQLLGAEGPDPSLVIPSLADMNNKGKDHHRYLMHMVI